MDSDDDDRQGYLYGETVMTPTGVVRVSDHVLDDGAKGRFAHIADPIARRDALLEAAEEETNSAFAAALRAEAEVQDSRALYIAMNQKRSER